MTYDHAIISNSRIRTPNKTKVVTPCQTDASASWSHFHARTVPAKQYEKPKPHRTPETRFEAFLARFDAEFYHGRK